MGLGERIKKLRINNNISVRKLADKVGVSASFIYQLEQDKVAPSFSTLKSIASHLHTSLAILIEDELPEEWVIVRKLNRRRIVSENSGVELGLLTFLGAREKKMQPIVFELEAGARSTEMNLFTDPQREDFIYLLSGQVLVQANQREFHLNEGDAAYFIFETPVLIKNTGEERATGLWIISPPGI